MDIRAETFVEKFQSAQAYLSCHAIQDITSIKFRANTSNSDYRLFVNEYLIGELGLDATQVDGHFYGHAWVLSNKNNDKVLLIEHESGLEILYVAGSIASLLGLIPSIISGWKFIQSKSFTRPSFINRGTEIEIRKLEHNNELIEQHISRIEDYFFSESMEEITRLRERVAQLEKELSKIKNSNVKISSSKKPNQSIKKDKKPISENREINSTNK